MPELESALASVFEVNFSLRGELGASVSVWKEGREIAWLWGGYCDRARTQAWTPRTLALVYSATKGPAAACVVKCLAEAGLELEGRVAGVWPEFGAAGKEEVTFGQVLAHQAGLAALDREADVFDYPEVIHAIEAQEPLWRPGDGHGYHPRTSGYIWDEIVRRLTGHPLGEYWRAEFAEPLELEFWMGLPHDRMADVTPLHAARQAPAEDEFLEEFANPASLTSRAFASPQGLYSVGRMNSPEARAGSFPGFGGIGTARALARFYAMLAGGGVEGGRRYLPEAAVPWLWTRRTNGFDRVLRLETAFSAGFMMDPADAAGGVTRETLGRSARAFGQPGAGGSVAFGDPERGLGFAYVMNQMEPGVLPNAKSLLLIERLYASG